MRTKFEEKPIKQLDAPKFIYNSSGILIPYSKLQQELETYKMKSEIKPRKHNIMRSQDEAARSMGIL